MDEFTWLDLLLLGTGCKIKRSNIFIQILDTVMLILMITCYGATLFSSFENYSQVGANYILGMMEKYSSEVCGIIFIIVIRKNRNDLQTLLKETSEKLTTKQKSSLKRLAAVCLFIILMTITQDAVMTRYHLLSNTSGEIDKVHEIMDWLRTYHNLNSWLLGGCCFFAFMVNIIKYNEENYFNQLELGLESVTPENSCTLILERKAVMDCRRKLIKCFGIIPCLWFLHVFVRAPVVVMEVKSPLSSGIEDAWAVLPLIYELFAIGFVVYECEKCSHVTRKRVSDIMMFLIREDKIETMSVFAAQMEKSGEEDFTTWKTISINRGFYFGFLCSVVSFTILVLQTTKEIFGDVPPVLRSAHNFPTFKIPFFDDEPHVNHTADGIVIS
jgi:hypothetical protein